MAQNIDNLTLDELLSLAIDSDNDLAYAIADKIYRLCPDRSLEAELESYKIAKDYNRELLDEIAKLTVKFRYYNTAMNAIKEYVDKRVLDAVAQIEFNPYADEVKD